MNMVLLFSCLLSMIYRFSYAFIELLREQNVYVHFISIKHSVRYTLFLISIRSIAHKYPMCILNDLTERTIRKFMNGVFFKLIHFHQQSIKIE